jgi:hypothetical protein
MMAISTARGIFPLEVRFPAHANASTHSLLLITLSPLNTVNLILREFRLSVWLREGEGVV